MGRKALERIWEKKRMLKYTHQIHIKGWKTRKEWLKTRKSTWIKKKINILDHKHNLPGELVSVYVCVENKDLLKYWHFTIKATKFWYYYLISDLDYHSKRHLKAFLFLFENETKIFILYVVPIFWIQSSTHLCVLTGQLTWTYLEIVLCR